MRDPELLCIVQDLREGKNLGNQNLQFSLLGNVVFNGSRVYVPTELRKHILHELHEGHFGVVKMKALARTCVYWPKLDLDIENLAHVCPHCIQTMKNPPKVAPHSWIPAEKPWERVHIDFAEFKKQSLFVLVDAYSKWPEVYPVPNQLTSSVIQILQELFTRFGIPRILVSDNGPQFTSSEFQQFLKQHNIIHKTSAPFHPATNGQAERYVGTIKRALRTLDAELPSVPLIRKVNRFLFAYRRTPHAGTGVSPAERFLGRALRSALDFLKPDKKPEKQTDPFLRIPHFDLGERVAIRDYASPNRPWLVGSVLSSEGPLSYTVNVNGVFYRRHVNQMRKVGSTVTSTATFSSPAAWKPATCPAEPLLSSGPPSALPAEPTISPGVIPEPPEMPPVPLSSATTSPVPPAPATPVALRRSERIRHPPLRFSP